MKLRALPLLSETFLCYYSVLKLRLPGRVGLGPLFLVGDEREKLDKNTLIRCLWQDLETPIAALGYELLEIEHTGSGGQLILRFFIDKAGGGVGLDDCAAVTRAVSPLLDEWDYVDGRYLLEVSSPGIDRPLRKAAHFKQYVGEKVVVATHAPAQGRKKFSGTLEKVQDDLITVICDGQPYEIHLENLKKAHLDR